jgi:2-dehydro-3-deoxygluconokinase
MIPGDCFMAGLIYDFLSNPRQPQELINYATTLAFGKLQEHEDATEQDALTVEEESMVKNTLPDLVKRTT